MDLQQLNYRHLFYFWRVAAVGHLTRVARELHVSQSALSIQIRQLEEQIGSPLFFRTGKRLMLTELGSLVFRYAEGIFELGSELVATLRTGESFHRIRIGAVATLSRNFQENFLHPLLQRADLQFVLESGTLDELLGELRSHKLDIVLSNRPVSADSKQPWRSQRIDRQPVCLVGADPKKAKRFRFPRSLQQERILLPSRKSDIRTGFDQLCEDHSLTFDIVAEVDDMAMLRLMARDSGIIALVPEVVVQDELRQKALYKYSVVPNLFENFYAITLQREIESPLIRELLRGI